MPRLTTLVLGFIAAILCGSIVAANTQPTIQSINKMPLSFTKNMGQWDDRVLFRANAGGATMWFTKEGVTYQFTRRIDTDNTPLNPLSRGDSHLSAGIVQNESIPLLRGARGVSDKDSIEQLILNAKFLGANPNPEVFAEDQLEYKCNYFLGNDPTKWYTDVPNYEAITLKDIYSGIDLKYSGDGSGQAAYEFIAAPGADIAQIKVAYEGAEETSLDADGRTILKTKWGDMTAAINSPTNGVLSGTGSLSQLSEKTIGFEAGGARRQALGAQSVVLSYSTYLGGNSIDDGYGIAVDVSGNTYVTGLTMSTNLPTQNPYQAGYQGGYSDVFVTKMSTSGSSLIYSTYLGGEDDDWGFDIAVDGSGNAYVTGRTWSSNFPTQNPYQTDQDSVDAFVTKLSTTGNTLIYSTYLGGADWDDGQGIAVDENGNAYVTGHTGSFDFPTQNPYQTYLSNINAFVSKLSSAGNSLIYSTCLGWNNAYGYDIAVDASGNAYVTGCAGPNLPTLNPYQTYRGSMDAFVTKLSSTGNSLIYSTYLGGGDWDWGFGIAVDRTGNAYVTGQTFSSNFPTRNPYQTYQGNRDVFVTKLSSSGNSLIYSTYLGGGAYDWGYGIAVDVSGNAYVTGVTFSSNFPTLNPYQMDQDTVDAFVTKLSSSGSSLIYSTYLGGGSYDGGLGIAVDGSGNAYVTGGTSSTNFPTLNPYQTFQGAGDAFVTKLSDGGVGKAGFFVHITDLHVAAGSNQGWPEKIKAIRELNPAPAFVVATGDVVNWGFDEDNDGGANYSELIQPLHGSWGSWFIDEQLTIPIYFCPGNHDAYQWDFLLYGIGGDESRRRGFENYVEFIGPFYYTANPAKTNITLFSLNSGMDEEGQAEIFSAPESEGLDEYNFNRLRTDIEGGVGTGRGKFVMMHHPHLGDGRFLNNNVTFTELCDEYKVEAVLCGHTHKEKAPYKSDGTDWGFAVDTDTTAYVVTRELKNEGKHHGFYRKFDFDANGKITAISGNIEFPYSGVEIVKMSPVDLIVTDPIGATIDRWSSTIQNASYEMYELTPGDTGATIYIPHPLEGVYHIEVTPMASAAPTDDYSLYFANGGDTVWLAQDSLISSIPEEGFQVTVIDTLDVDDGDQSPVLPEKPALDQNYPNPFNPSTEIGFDLPKSSFVSLEIYDVLGREVTTLINERLTSGSKRVQWNGRDNMGAEVASGVYFYRLQIGDHVEVKKMVLLK